jgi:hypothetical protein
MFEFVATIALARANGLTARFLPWEAAPFFALDPEFFDPYLDLSRVIDARSLVADGLPRYVVDWLQDPAFWGHDSDGVVDLLQPASDVTHEVDRLFLDFDVDPAQTTVLHIRRGDFLELAKYFPVATAGYYLKGLAEFSEVGTPLLVSEDREWCRQELMPRIPGARLLPHAPAAVHLFAMSRCARAVISNSTFAWWSAYLNPAMQVVSPKRWVTRPGYDGGQLTIDGWTAIDIQTPD